MEILIFYFIILTILLFILYFTKSSIKEGMIVDSNAMQENVYSKYGIKIDKENNNLIYKGKTINYMDNFNNEKGIKISNDKIKTNDLLTKTGFPVCNFIKWNNDLDSESNLLNINNKLKFPVVVKDNYGEKGIGVYTDVYTNDELIDKIKSLKKNNRNSILIEEQAVGDKYRVMIFNDKFIYANKQIKPVITGDGVSSIQELIDNYPKSINIINIDLIKQQGYNLNDVPKKNNTIEVTNVLNANNGIQEVPAKECDVHPINLDMFSRLNKEIGLNLTGIDYIGPDLSIPYLDGGKIIEVNPYPAFNITEQKKPHVAKNWVDALNNFDYN
jgi:cyanophycin synthetase